MNAWRLFIIAATLAPVAALGEDPPGIGKLGVALGKNVTVQGVIVSGPSKGYEGGPNILVQRIDGRAIQSALRLPLSGTEGQQLLPRKTYELRGRETGSFVGANVEALSKSGLAAQTTSRYFRHEFAIDSAKPIKPIAFHPREFKGRGAIFEGVAVTERDKAWVQADDGSWRVLAGATLGWQSNLEGKRIETHGVHKQMGMKRKDFALERGRWRPANLENQLGQQVELRGTAKSVNGIWWFSWRGTDLYVRDLEKLPGWTDENHWRQIIVRGKLDRMKMPRLDQITLVANPDLADYFVMFDASWEPLPTGQQLLAPELPIDEIP